MWNQCFAVAQLNLPAASRLGLNYSGSTEPDLVSAWDYGLSQGEVGHDSSLTTILITGLFTLSGEKHGKYNSRINKQQGDAQDVFRPVHRRNVLCQSIKRIASTATMPAGLRCKVAEDVENQVRGV
jgi:hypothetical protein